MSQAPYTPAKKKKHSNPVIEEMTELFTWVTLALLFAAVIAFAQWDGKDSEVSQTKTECNQVELVQ